MSQSVSQIEYWRESNKSDNSDKQTNAKEAGLGASYLSYDVFLGLTVLGGILGLDHLYLRSPLTFIAKIIVNFLTFGSWWIYDASQAVFNKEVVKVFGLGVPGMGPKGIGAGTLVNDIPDKKHMSFFIYGLVLMLGGLFGLDSFIVGDKYSGFIRLICLISFILAPVAIFWWLLNIGKFFFKTKDVTSQNWEYFGAQPPAEYGMTLGEKIATYFPFLQTLLGPISTAKNIVVNTAEVLGESVLTTAIQPVLAAAAPFKETLNSGIATVQDGLALGKNVLNTGKEIVDKTLNVVGQTADASTKALSLVPGAAALSEGLTAVAAQQALNKLNQQGGGSDSTILPYAMIGTLIVIVVSGLVITYRQYRQNEQPRKNDSPPEPGILRKSDKEKSF